MAEKISGDEKLQALHILLCGFELPFPQAVWVTGVYAALCTLPWAGWAANATGLFTLLYRIAVILLLAIGLWRSSALCRLLLSSAQSKMEFAENKTFVLFLEKVYRALVAVFAGMIIINEFGFDVTSLVTGIGLVGLTVSLAAQDTASNLVSGLVILLEAPFQVGDWVRIDTVEGTVEDITFRSTKIRALDNSLYVMPNSAVSAATLNNGTKRTKRMFRFTLSVMYTTRRSQLEQLIADLEQMLRTHAQVYEDSVMVRITGFGAASIDILVNCYVKTPDYAEFLVIQNELNLNILDVMQRNEVGFATSAAKVYLK